MGKTAELLPGTLDMLIPKAVSLKPLDGYGVLLRIRQISGNALEIPQGSFISGPLPVGASQSHHLRVGAEREKSPGEVLHLDRRLRDETEGWNRLTSAIAAALNTTPEDV